MPVVALCERDTRTIHPLLDGLDPTIGWCSRLPADGGPAYAVLRRGFFGFLRVVESFPLTEDGWSGAWQSFVTRNPAAAPTALAVLRERANDTAREDIERGLLLLALQAQAADRRALGWVKRRVEQLEILDTRAVRWRVSVDFEMPAEAPVICVGGEQFRLVPVMMLPKGDLVAFDLRDERDDALWLPTSDENNRRLAPALVEIARRAMAPEPLPRVLEQNLMRIVATRPSRHKAAYEPFAAAAALIDVLQFEKSLNETSARLYQDRFWQVRKRWRASREWNSAQAALTRPLAAKRAAEALRRDLDPEIRDATDKLMADRWFRSQLEDLAKNYIVIIAVRTETMTRRIVKLTSERRVTFWSRTSKRLRLLQSLGWRCWPLRVPLGGRGGSHHLEVAAPPGVDVVRIVARPVRPTGPGEPRAPELRAAGFSPHVHISIPAVFPLRYRATIYVRTSRSGWLLASFLVGIVIAVVMMLGRHYVSDLLRTSDGVTSPEAGTAATLLLTLLGVIALWLIRPGEHPLASRLLLLVRGLILIDVTVLLIGTGDLVLHTGHRPPTALWSGLGWTATVVAAALTLSWLMPRKLPWRGGNRGRPGYASDVGGADR